MGFQCPPIPRPIKAAGGHQTCPFLGEQPLYPLSVVGLPFGLRLPKMAQKVQPRPSRAFYKWPDCLWPLVLPSVQYFLFFFFYHFTFSCCSWDSWGKNTGVICRSLLQWAVFCQNSSLWPVCLTWSCREWFLSSLSYLSPFALTGLWFVKDQGSKIPQTLKHGPPKRLLLLISQ